MAMEQTNLIYHGMMIVIVGGMKKWKMLNQVVIQFGLQLKIHFLYFTPGKINY